jgi:hypothetical protein
MTGEMTAVVLALALSLSGTARAQQAAVVSGTVVDPIGAAVTDARVALAAADGTPAQIATTGAKGEFAFPDVPAGSYVVRVDVTGFTPFSTGAFTVGDGGRLLTVPPIVLAVEGFSTSVVVRATEAIAEEQIKAQEQQRWLGVFPSFYVSYLPNAAPMTSRQKLTLAAHETLDWTAFVGASVAAAVDQSGRAPGIWRRRIRIRKTVGGELRRRPDRRLVEPLRVRVRVPPGPAVLLPGHGHDEVAADPRTRQRVPRSKRPGTDDAELCPDFRQHRRRGSVERVLPAFGTRSEFDGLEPCHQPGEPGGESCHPGIPRQTTHKARAGWRLTP